jgi:hypothetical protein
VDPVPYPPLLSVLSVEAGYKICKYKYIKYFCCLLNDAVTNSRLCSIERIVANI